MKQSNKLSAIHEIENIMSLSASKLTINKKNFIAKSISKNCLLNHLIPSLLLNEKDKGSF